MTDLVEQAFELNTILKENIEMLTQIFGELPELPAEDPKPEKKPGRKKGNAVSVKIDRGKLLALHNAG